ncbi:hypothetical protein PR048_020786 [Dryococelus australis]|uniref:Glycosyl hydrolase family 31 C-terminal domain-containing protein n=1 Tax=Dryococelus australis TaxID=614101 RepID=A0ABQ9GWD5_9NEOP|nr:hypothetical protein PR048_020786 [Dryococelus australis]
MLHLTLILMRAWHLIAMLKEKLYTKMGSRCLTAKEPDSTRYRVPFSTAATEDKPVQPYLLYFGLLCGVRFPAGSLPDFHMWKSCWTMPLVGRFSRGSPEYLLGEDILVAPVMTQGATSRDVYLPQGRWRDGLHPDHSLIEGRTWLRNYSASLSELPYFIRETVMKYRSHYGEEFQKMQNQ